MDQVDHPTGEGDADKQGLPCEGTDSLRASLSSGTAIRRGVCTVPQPRIQRVQTKAMAFLPWTEWLWKASRKVRPMYGFAPLFIWVVGFVGFRKFFKRPAWHLDHAVIDRRFPARGGGPGHVVP